MCQARSAHRLGIVLGDRGLIPGRERGCNSACAARLSIANVPAELLAQRIHSAACCGRDDFHGADRTTDTADTLEPGIAGEVVATG
jgi:hypothetical protein